MKRRRVKQEETKPALFPFLDVLLCTIGTLIVLLIVITSQAWVQAKQAAEVVPETPPINPEDDPETWKSRIDNAETAYTSVSKVVGERRAELGYLEDHTREMQMKIVELQAAVKERSKLASATDQEIAKTEAEVVRLTRNADEVEQTLKELRRENQSKPAEFSIIPYEGPNRTPRRPIFIECRADQVVIQPEGIVLTVEDFVLADDPGNPLATALRAAREHLAGGKSLAASQEPYPLIVVRPDGIGAYYQVRQALQGWTSDFGYEFVGADWKLKFMPADPLLYEVEQQALAEARLRQKSLVAMAERKAKRSRRFRPAPGGGILQENGGGGSESTAIRYRPGAEGGAGNGDFAAGSGQASGNAGNVNGIPNAAATPATNGLTGTAAGGAGTNTSTGNRSASRNNIGGQINSATGYAGGREPQGGAQPNALAGQPHGTGQSSTPGNSTGGTGTQPTGSQNPSQGGNQNIGQSNGPKPRGSQSSSDVAANGPGGGEASPSGRAPSSIGGTPDIAPSAQGNPNSLAKQRGKDWGLKFAEPTATPVTRPLRIICDSQRVYVSTDDPSRGPKEILLKPTTRESVDEVVAAVWEEIGRWGIAGKGMYWRPILSFDVQPGGMARYDDFRKLLDGSGLEVRQRGAATATQPMPAARRGVVR